MLFGNCVGIVTWICWMRGNLVYFSSEQLDSSLNMSLFDRADYAFQLSMSRSWFSTFYVAYATEFLALSLAQLLVLDRMSQFLQKQRGGTLSRLCFIGERVATALVLSGNAVGLAGNVVAAVFRQESGALYNMASSSFNANDFAKGEEYQNAAKRTNRYSLDILNVQYLCEVLVLLVAVSAFFLVGASCYRVVTSALAITRSDSLLLSGASLQRHIVSTTAVVCSAFLLRLFFSMTWLAAFRLNDQWRDSADGGSKCLRTQLQKCDPCYNSYTHLMVWMVRTPELQAFVVLLSSPIAMLVALYGMTSTRMKQMLKRKKQNNENLIMN
jgi:hypothetical protein